MLASVPTFCSTFPLRNTIIDSCRLSMIISFDDFFFPSSSSSSSVLCFRLVLQIFTGNLFLFKFGAEEAEDIYNRKRKEKNIIVCTKLSSFACNPMPNYQP